MKPTIGRIVHTFYKGEVAPAVVTKVHSDRMVNLRVLPDYSNETPAVTSVNLHENEETALAITSGASPEAGYHAWWPARG